MPEPLASYLPKMTALFYICVEAEGLPRQSADIVVSNITRLGDRR